MFAIATQMSDDDRLRVTRWSFDPGSETGVHTHEFDYVVVPITGGQLTSTDGSDEVLQMQQVAGESYARNKGATHNVRNNSLVFVEFVEIELLIN
jgi:quercetin dioxygenase-like cupin family protein